MYLKHIFQLNTKSNTLFHSTVALIMLLIQCFVLVTSIWNRNHVDVILFIMCFTIKIVFIFCSFKCLCILLNLLSIFIYDRLQLCILYEFQAIVLYGCFVFFVPIIFSPWCEVYFKICTPNLCTCFLLNFYLSHTIVFQLLSTHFFQCLAFFYFTCFENLTSIRYFLFLFLSSWK